MDSGGLQDILCRLCSCLIRSQTFENVRIRGKYCQVIIDGTQATIQKMNWMGKACTGYMTGELWTVLLILLACDFL